MGVQRLSRTTLTTRHITSSPSLPDEAFFRTFLFKVAARCNIACTYCYEYRLADQSWRTKPVRMSREVLGRTIERMIEHIVGHRIPVVNVVFHGGEPLLAGRTFLRHAVTELRERLAPHCSVTFGIQSNGTLLNEEWLDLLKDLGLTVGVSLDGPRQLNDRFRVDHRQQSTFPAVERALRLLQEERYSSVKSGMLCVIQPDSDPVKVLGWFADLGENKLDLLFPHHNYQVPPPYRHDPVSGYGFGVWLATAFDYWWDNDVSSLRIRIFEDIIHLLLGGYFSVESLGLSPARIIVIQTDGAYEALDSLKSAFDGAVRLGKDVFSNPLDDVLNEELVLSRIFRSNALCDTCKSCRFANVCGGGYVPHRFHPDVGFAMPSIYCQDLMFLISHIESRLLASGRSLPSA